MVTICLLLNMLKDSWSVSKTGTMESDSLIVSMYFSLDSTDILPLCVYLTSQNV